MPSEIRTTGVISIDGQISINTSILRGRIDSRKRIHPADLDLIKDTYNLFRQHTHQMFDEQFRQFGNTSPQGSASRTTDSEEVAGAPDLTYTIELEKDDHGTFADNIFDLIDTFNNFVHIHEHEWDDQSF